MTTYDDNNDHNNHDHLNYDHDDENDDNDDKENESNKRRPSSLDSASLNPQGILRRTTMRAFEETYNKDDLARELIRAEGGEATSEFAEFTARCSAESTSEEGASSSAEPDDCSEFGGRVVRSGSTAPNAHAHKGNANNVKWERKK